MNTQAQAKERLFGFDVVSPRDIMEPGGFANAPTNPQTAIIVQKSVLTALSYDHHVWEGLDHVHVWGHNQLRKQTETQLHFHWEVLREIQTEAVPVELTLEFDHGLERVFEKHQGHRLRSVAAAAMRIRVSATAGSCS